MRYSFALVAALGCISAAQADVVYSWTTETGSRYNPGPATGGTAQRIVLDDVMISNSLLGGMTQLQVNSVTFGIRRLASAVPVDVSLYFAPFMGTTYNNSSLTSVNFVATQNLAANGASAVTQLVTFSNPGGLFTVSLNPDITGAAPNFSGFFLGVQFSNNDSTNGWRIVSGGTAGANFTTGFMAWNPDNGTATGPLAFTGEPPPPSAFYIVIDGTPVPTPGALALLGLGGLAMIRRRR